MPCVQGDLTMPQKFILEITLGNEAMQTPADIAGALYDAADRVGEGSPNSGVRDGKIWDINGNVVGKYEVTE